jgi:hypothetical protein
LRCLPLCFKAVLGLKINLSKSEIVPVGAVGDAKELASIFGCGVASLPIKYLGLPLSVKYKDSNTWTSIIEKMEARLAGCSVGSRESEALVVNHLLFADDPLIFVVRKKNKFDI